MKKIRVKPVEKTNLHPKNAHRKNYDFTALTEACPELKSHVFVNDFGTSTILFSDPLAVKSLNKALLQSVYGIAHWDIPPEYLCPPIPGRADYIHYLNDLISEKKPQAVSSKAILGLDIGTGANGIYPLLGNKIYGWHFVGTETDSRALDNFKKILDQNGTQKNAIELRKQNNPNFIFKGIIQENEYYDFTLCNPPFHSSYYEAREASNRKVKNLSGKILDKPERNFGGQSGELWCPGGELIFIEKMMEESSLYSGQVGWFTTLVSKQTTLDELHIKLKQIKAKEIRVIDMAQGQKISRILAWHY